MRYLLVLLCLLIALPAQAQRIVASVNDEAISSSDLDGRLRLALLGSGIKPDQATLDKLGEQILRAMIDERIQMQEAKRVGVTVEQKEIDEQKARLAQQNNLKPDQLDTMFKQAGVPLSALENQIRVSIAWAKVVQRVLRPKVAISDDDVDAEIARINANAGKPEYLVAEIFLPVDKAAQADKVKATAQRLLEQLSRGARFSVVARQFSQSATSSAGGDMGWIQPGQLEPELDKALLQMKPGTVTTPIRTASGYYLLMLRDVRTGQRIATSAADVAPAAAPEAPKAAQPASYTLRQLVAPLPAKATDAQVQAAAKELEALRPRLTNCSEMEKIAKQRGDKKGGAVGLIKASEMPAPVRSVVEALPENTPSPLMKNPKGAVILMVCSRSGGEVAAPAPAPAPLDEAGAREKITNALGGQKLELLARRYLRDLRQNAFIEVRQ